MYVFYVSWRLWEAHLFVFYMSWRLWEVDLYVFYEVLRPPRFEGPGCGRVKLARIGAHPSRADRTKDLQLDLETWNMRSERYVPLRLIHKIIKTFLLDIWRLET